MKIVNCKSEGCTNLVNKEDKYCEDCKKAKAKKNKSNSIRNSKKAAR